MRGFFPDARRKKVQVTYIQIKLKLYDCHNLNLLVFLVALDVSSAFC